MRLLLVTTRAAWIASVREATAGPEREVRVVEDVAAGLASLARDDAEVVVLDTDLSAPALADACRRIRATSRRAPPTVVVSVDPGRAEELATELEGIADDFLVAPCGPAMLCARLRIAERAFAERVARRDVDLRHRQIVDSGIVGVAVADLGGTIMEGNEAFLRITGYAREDLQAGKVTWESLTPPEWREAEATALARLAGSGAVELREREFVRSDGTRVPVLVGTVRFEDSVERVIGFVADISRRKTAELALRASRQDLERRVQERTAALEAANEELRSEIAQRRRAQEALQRSEAQLLHAQKMDAVGRLAGGIAHDFNNVLSVILSYTSMDIPQLPPGSPLRRDLEEIQAAGERAASLIRRLLAFGRRQVVSPKRVDLNDAIAGMEDMLRRVLGEGIELTTRAEPNLGRVNIDPGQLEQVIMNLAINARDAMAGAGKLAIETADVAIDESSTADPGLTAGSYVMLAISDTGIGMDAATKARIFEPFFTTKREGEGTGLGLATVFGIVSQSRGHIDVDSEPGKGTTFRLYFPRAGDRDMPGAIPAPVAPPQMPRGSETILVVEDNERVRGAICAILRGQGYDVLEAQSGSDALSICEQHAAPIDLLVTDVVMPQMGGRQLAEQIRSLRPGTKVLYVSGYAYDAIAHEGVIPSAIALLQKPVTAESLARRVREVLDGGK